MLTSKHGKNDGFSLVEASVSLFIAGTLLLAVIGFTCTAIRYTKKITSQTATYIQQQNEYAQKTP